MPPPEWADPAEGRRWTQSWRARPTAAQPRAAAGTARPAARPAGTGAQPRRATGAWPAAAGPRRPSGCRPGPRPRRRRPGAPRPGDRRQPDARPRQDHRRARRTTGAMRATGAMRTTGAQHGGRCQHGGALPSGRPARHATGAMRPARCARRCHADRQADRARHRQGADRSCPSWCSAVIALGFLGVAVPVVARHRCSSTATAPCSPTSARCSACSPGTGWSSSSR